MEKNNIFTKSHVKWHYYDRRYSSYRTSLQSDYHSTTETNSTVIVWLIIHINILRFVLIKIFILCQKALVPNFVKVVIIIFLLFFYFFKFPLLDQSHCQLLTDTTLTFRSVRWSTFKKQTECKDYQI